MRSRTARGRVGRSGGPNQPDGGGTGTGESVGRVIRVGSRGVGGGREGRSVGHPVSRLSGRGGPVGRQISKRNLLFLHEKRKRFIQQMPARIGHYSHAKQKQEQLNLELGAALSSNRIVGASPCNMRTCGATCRTISEGFPWRSCAAFASSRGISPCNMHVQRHSAEPG